MFSHHRRDIRWPIVSDNLRSITDSDPAMPEGLDDRAQDNWRILIAIADQAGGHWPETARVAAVALSSEAAKGDDGMSRGVLLLRDIREVMGDQESMSSKALIDALIDMDEAPWREWRGGKPITANSVARMLKLYKVGPHRGRGGSTYRASDLQDPWSRYLNQPETRDPTANCDPTATKNHSNINDLSQVAVGRSSGEGVSASYDHDTIPESSGTIRGVI